MDAIIAALRAAATPVAPAPPVKPAVAPQPAPATAVAPAASAPVSAAAEAPQQAPLQAMFEDGNTLLRAIVASEVLSPPLALRENAHWIGPTNAPSTSAS